MKRGVTLVELLVVTSIVGMLVAIAVPAVNAARDAARNTERLNWRRQRVLDSPPDRKEPFRVLFVGNSHTYVNDIPGLVSEMSRLGGTTEVLADSVTEGGKSLEYHWETGRAAEAIRDNWFDFVVLQDQSTMPCTNGFSFVEHNETFSELIKDSRSIPLLYMLFEREKDCPDGYCPQDTITNATKEVLKRIQGGDGAGEISPVGEAWRVARRTRPSLALHQPDGNHSNDAGSYLTACVFYSVIHRSSPHGLPPSISTPIASISVPEYDAKFLQQVAWDTSEKWRRKTRAWFLK